MNPSSEDHIHFSVSLQIIFSVLVSNPEMHHIHLMTEEAQHKND